MQWKDLTLTPGDLRGRNAEESAEGIVPPHDLREGWNLFNEGLPRMRKSIGHQKRTPVGQQNLFEAARNPAGKPADGIGIGQSVRDELLSRLREQHAQTANITERSADYVNLDKAFLKVERNKGSGGVDGMEVTELRDWLGTNLGPLRESLLGGTYEPSPVRKVEVPKASGGKRALGIPTVKDRFVQQAIHQQLCILYDPHFSENSFGFRPNRSAHGAIEQASGFIKKGNEWVVDIDFENFFDRIHHDRLMTRLSKGIGDKRLLRLINAFLKAGMMEGGMVEQRVAGTPQGGPLSPLLSNIVLDELDKELESRGHSFCRYADDCNIYVRSRRAGERVMKSVVEFIENVLKLKVNTAKSGVRHCSEVKFLGYTLLPGGGKRVADKSIARLKAKVKQITRRNRGVKFEQVIGELNSSILGWSQYFRLANKWLGALSAIDGWIRRKLRCYRLKQCGRPYTVYKLMRSLGTPEQKSWNIAMRYHGWWNMSQAVAVRQGMGLDWFARQGLHSLEKRVKAAS